MKQKHQLATIKDKNELMTVKVSDKGQIALPRLLQRMIGIHKGDRLVVYAMDNKIMLKKINEIVSELSDDFKDMDYYTEKSLAEVWKNEPEGLWEEHLKNIKTKKSGSKLTA